MVYQPKRLYEQPPPAVKVAMLLALAGCLLAAVQAVLLVVRGNPICLNEGCEIVDALTTVPPVVVNLVGSLYFLALFWCLYRGRSGVRIWLITARILLLAGIAAEGVLVGYQFFVAGALCSYCLVVFALIVALNLLVGVYQIIGGVAVWTAVFVVFAGLTFVPVRKRMGPVLEGGAYGRLAHPEASRRLYLFFSSDCSHCEEVLASIDNRFSCDLTFNPVDTVGKVTIPGLVRSPGYSAEVNRSFLRNLGIETIPTLYVKGEEKMEVLTGERQIRQYLEGNCRPVAKEIPQPRGGVSGKSESGMPFLQSTVPDETCTVGADCDNPGGGHNAK